MIIKTVGLFKHTRRVSNEISRSKICQTRLIFYMADSVWQNPRGNSAYNDAIFVPLRKTDRERNSFVSSLKLRKRKKMSPGNKVARLRFQIERNSL